MKKNGKIAFLLTIMLGNYRYFIFCISAMLINVLLSYLPAKIVGVTADSVFGTLPFDLPEKFVSYIEGLGGREFFLQRLYIPGAAIITASVLSAAFMYIRTYEADKLSENLAMKIRKMMFEHIQRLPFSWHKSVQTGDIMQRCSSDVTTICQFVSSQFADVIRIIVMLSTAYVLMFTINFKLAFASFCFVPVIIFYSGFFFSKIAKRFLDADRAEGALNSVAQENFTGIRVVKAFGREISEYDKFRKANGFFSQLWIKTGKWLALYWSLGDLMSLSQMALIIIYGSYLTVSGHMTPGEILIFSMYGSMISWPMRTLGRVVGEMSKAGVSMERIAEIMDTPEEDFKREGLCPEIKGNISFKHVSFAYDGINVLEDVSFDIKAGETLAILGNTGSGKSSLVHLIDRLYDLKDGCGEILVDGININDISLGYLRRNIGIVLQEPFLFSDTIENNLRFAAEDMCTDDEMYAFANIAAIHETILGFPKGYQTVIGEKGVTLSGGQRQRIAIARMLAQKTPVIVFDDSLSAVDVQTDTVIRSALKNHRNNGTSIIIAHRIVSLMDADHILVLQNGRVVEYGDHETLMQSGGIYSEIFAIQSQICEETEASSDAE